MTFMNFTHYHQLFKETLNKIELFAEESKPSEVLVRVGKLRAHMEKKSPIQAFFEEQDAKDNDSPRSWGASPVQKKQKTEREAERVKRVERERIKEEVENPSSVTLGGQDICVTK